MSLAGKIALVTGASRGLGRAVAWRLAQDGAAIAINYQHQAEQAESLAEQIRSAGGRALPLRADIGDRDQVRSMVAHTEAELGPIAILVNNAGVLYLGDLANFDPVQMDLMQRTNVIGLVNATQAVADGMKQRRWGRIVNVTSIAAHGTSLAGTSFYAATKAAVSLLTRRFALELGPCGITVNAVAPGFILTDMVRQGRTEEEATLLIERMSRVAMMQRVGRPEDIAHAVWFLVSPASSFITAQVLTVDGGRMDYIAHP